MKILVVGNVLRDIYLNLDSRTEHAELDKKGVKWLNIGFNASEHHFFSRESSLGGAAVTLEVLQKLGLEAEISGLELDFRKDEPRADLESATTYRYILKLGDQVSYLAPSEFTKTGFATPDDEIDYLFIDRSAEIDITTSAAILDYLEKNPRTKLVIYVRHLDNVYLDILLSSASLVFTEVREGAEIDGLDPSKVIFISDQQIEYANVREKISLERVDTMTHLSAYSIAAATILGSFIKGGSVEDSLKLARLNMENSRLNSVLSLDELKELMAGVTPKGSLELIARSLLMHPKGILAADESGGSIHKKFEQLKIDDTYESRRDYRNLFFTTPNLERYVNGVILFDETARQTADDGQDFTNYLISRRIIPGIKVDQGLEQVSRDVSGCEVEETITKGLEGLDARLAEYYQMGLRFAKWRAAFKVIIDESGRILTPSDKVITDNCRILAEYAKKCQEAGIVPIVEPELVYDGDYDAEISAQLTGRILDCLFLRLKDEGVNLQACILKVNMVLAGKKFSKQSTPEEVGRLTAETLKNHVPAELAGVVFLSGGQTPEQATDNLAEITKNGPFPWPVTFSFARALQDPALYAWKGDNHNISQAQEAFAERLKKNCEILEKPGSRS